MSFEDWLSASPYTEKRKQELREVRRSIEVTTRIPLARRCHRVKTHIKNESYPTIKNARLINARVDEYLVFAGPLAKSIEAVLYERPEFIKHVPVKDRPAVISALKAFGQQPHENDHVCFEGNLVPDFQDASEMVLCDWVAGAAAPDLCALVRDVETGKNVLKMRCGFSLAVEGERMSGTSFTSCFNGFDNLMSFLFVCHSNGLQGRGFVEGDDGLFMVSGKLTSDMFRVVGLTVEINPIADVSEGHFCGMTFTEDGTLIKDPRRVFQTFGWTSSFMGAGERIMDELLRSKSLSLACEMPQCPIVGALARRGLELTQGVVVRHHASSWQGPTAHQLSTVEQELLPFKPTLAARMLVQKLFAISVDDQIHIEALIFDDRLDMIQRLVPPSTSQILVESSYLEVT